MTKKIKKSLLAVSVLATVCSVSGAVVALDPVQGLNASASSVSLLDFETNFGASVRVSDPTGLRFKLKLSQAKKDEVFAQGSGKTLGMFIFPKSKAFVGECNYANLAQKINIEFAESDLYKKDGFWYANGVNTEMYIQNYDLEFIAVGYIKTGDTYEYSTISIEDNARSMAYVAARAYKAGEATAKTAEMIEKSVYASYGIYETKNPSYLLKDTNENGETWTTYGAMKEALPITIAVDENVSVMQGESVQLTPSFVVNGTNVELAELPFTYTVSSENIVCDNNGVVTGVTAGTVEITVNMGAYTATQTVTVTDEKYETLADITYYANKNDTLSIDLTAQKLAGITSLTIGGDVYAEGEYTFDGNTLNVAKATMEAKNPDGGDKAIEIIGATEAGAAVTLAGVIDYVNYAISTAEEFVNFQGMYKNSKAYNYIYTKVVLTNNIRLADNTSLNYLQNAGTFYGIFDGQGYTVSNFNVTSNAIFYEIGHYTLDVKTTEFKNVGFVGQRTAPASNHGGVLALSVNNAVLENVYVQATNTSTDVYTAAIAAEARGHMGATFKNCFVHYNSAGTIRSALVTSAIYSPYFENCYAISNNAKGMYSIDYDDVQVKTNCYATEEAFKAAVTALPKGFDSAYWTMKNGMLTFKTSAGEWRTIDGEQFVAGNKSQSLALNLGADVTAVSGVTIGGTAVTGYTLANGTLTVPFASITARGDVDVYVNATNSNGTALTVNATAKVVDYAIGTADEFKAFADSYATSLNNSKVYKYAVLTNNIDMSGKALANNTVNAYFYGVFDGQGYTVYGLHVNNYLMYTIGNPGGQATQFKNVALVNATRNASVAGGMLAFVIENAIVENVYIQGNQIGATTQTANGNNPGYTGALSDYAYDTATIRNCFVQFESAGHLKMAGALLSRAGTATVIENSYAISSSAVNLYGVIATSHGYSDITKDGNKANLYATVEAFAEDVSRLPNSFDTTVWTMVDGVPMFKSSAVIEIAEEQVVASNRNDALVLDLGAYGIEDVNNVVVGTTQINAYTYENGKLTVAYSNLPKAQSTVSVTAKTATGMVFVKAQAYVVDYAIGTATELEAFRGACVGKTTADPYMYVALTANIDYANGEYYGEGTAIGTFFGSFDGRGYTVSNVKVKNSFFPSIKGIYNGQRSVIKNFGLVNVIKHTGNGGALLANDMLDTDVDNVYVKGTVEVYTGTTTGAIGGTVYRTNLTNSVMEINYKNNKQAPALFGNVVNENGTTSVNNIYTLMTGSESYTYNLGGSLHITNHNMQYTAERFTNVITMAHVPAGFNECWSIENGVLTFTNAK